MGHDGSHQNGGGHVAVAMVSGGSYPDTTNGDTSLTLTGRHGDNSAVFFNVRGRDGGAMPESADVASVRSASGGSSRSYVASFDERNITSRENRSRVEYGDPSHTLHEAPPAIIGSGVRRLTPRECERLQGLPDNWTLVPYRGKPAADGPRYKAIGNSMAVPCMRWIGERIAAVEQIGKELAMAAEV